MSDPRIAAAAAWLQSDDTAYETQPDAAVRAAREMLAAADAAASLRIARKTTRDLYCNFCGKSQDEVLKLIAGPSAYICDECVELCMSINQGNESPINGETEYRSWSK